MRLLLEGKGAHKEIPRAQRWAHRPGLKSLFSGRVRQDKPARDAPSVPLHYGSGGARSGHTPFDDEQGHQAGKMNTVMSRSDSFSLRGVAALACACGGELRRHNRPFASQDSNRAARLSCLCRGFSRRPPVYLFDPTGRLPAVGAGERATPCTQRQKGALARPRICRRIEAAATTTLPACASRQSPRWPGARQA